MFEVARVEVAANEPRLDEVESLALQGRMLDALALLESVAPPEQLSGGRARCMAAWVYSHLGASWRSLRWYREEYAKAPADPSVLFYFGFSVLRYRGPLAAWLLLRNYRRPAGSSEVEHADLVSLQARVLAYLGDFQQADAVWQACDKSALGAPRIAAVEALLLDRREKRNEALELLQTANASFPHHRLIVQQLAGSLEAQNRREEALELLSAADAALQAPAIASQRASLENELGRYDAELASLARMEQLSLKGGAELQRELRARRAENHYLRGKFASAASLWRESRDEYWRSLADKLPVRDGAPDRKLLDLPVLLQEPMGCAPSALAIISKYFGHPVDHVDVADQICYEGTASHSERGWVEGRGWISREFTVDFLTAQTLIQRDVPFLLVTVAIASAHAQVVAGFDATRNTLLIRDPSSTSIQELDAKKLFERHRAYGPRGHVLLPPELAARLDGLSLPEAEIHDACHRLRLGMERGDGTSVEQRMRELEQLAPDHPLTLWARRSLAVRNGDPYAIRACSQQLLERFPDDVNAELSVLDCLASIGTTAEQEQRVLRHLEKPKPPWVYHERLAQLLSASAEELPRARSSVRKAHRCVPLRGATIGLWASLERDAGNVELSLCLRRAAATLEPTSDELARAYFEEAYRSGDCQSAFELLSDRVQRYRARSAEPLYVLFGALEWLDREREAFSELELGLERRPDDGQLLLFAANAHARYGRIEPGRALLERARGHVDPALFEQNAARIAELSGDLADALARYRAVLEAQPLSLRAHDAVADLCAQLHGLDEARRQLERACAQYPSHIGLRELYVHRLRGHDPTQVLAQLHVLLEQQPLHGWAKRERALVLSDLGEHERAIEEARHAVQLAPNHPSSQRILAGVLSASGRRTEALSAARKAVELWCDGPGTVSELLRLAGSLDEQLALARWCGDHVGEKSLDGIGLLEWHAFVIDILPRAELTAIAGRVHERRPNLWASQLLLARELNAAGQSDSAERLLMSACERFSVPRLQLELAGLRRTRGDVEGEARGLAAALRANPSWLEAILRAAGSLQYATDPDSARRILEKGLRFHPRSSALLLATARLEFKHGRVASALSCARQAVENQPEEAEGWALYASYARQLERAEDVGVLAHELTRQRPWNARIWLRLADVRALEAENLATIAALREALARDPDLPEAHDELAQALTRIGKRDEALQACEARMTNYAARGGLRARRAWVLWQFQAFDEACAEMRQVVTDHPDQLWGLQELVGWELEREKPAAAVELAQALVERAPLRCVAHGYLGQALLAAKDEEAAWEALTQASRLDPTYAYAGGRRVELAILRRHYADAEGVIAEQGEHVPVNTRDAWRLSLACARGRTREAMQLLLGMAERPTTSVEDLTIASQALPRLPVHELKPALTELARDPRTHAALGAIWVDTLRRVESAPSCIAVLRLRRHHSQAFMSALVAHFEALGDASTGFWRLLPSLVVLGLCAWGSDVAWGKVGYALARARAYAVCELWLSDYQRRSSIEAWMLQNLKLCALENHRFGAALRASEYALKLPTDVTLPQHLAFVAFGRATAGDLDAAREVVEGRSGSELSGGDWKLFEASRLLVKFAAAPEEERAVLLVELRALDFTASHLGGLDPLSGGVLQRRFAAGVLRQHFSSWFWLTRWMPLLCGLILLAAATLSPEKSGLRDLTISWSIIAACVALFLRWRA